MGGWLLNRFLLAYRPLENNMARVHHPSDFLKCLHCRHRVVNISKRPQPSAKTQGAGGGLQRAKSSRVQRKLSLAVSEICHIVSLGRINDLLTSLGLRRHF